jgi:mannose-6-phosphate isomerase-like protein (cupin superfamily)
MKIFNIRDFYQRKYQEYIVGSSQIGKHSVYLVYGEVVTGKVRTMAPGGHDEILFLLSGKATLEDGGMKTPIQEEQAVYLGSDEILTFTALTECRYVIAGTHTTPHEH